MNPLTTGFEGIISPDSVEANLLKKLDPIRLPQHIAIIMDGNGRWARIRKLPRIQGHRAGVKSVKSVIEYAARLTIPVLTLYAFSSENWKRPEHEVNTLWRLLRQYLRSDLVTLQQNNIRFNTIGRISELPSTVQKQLAHVIQETSSNTGMKLFLALNYSGRTELVDVFNKLLKSRNDFPIEAFDIESCLYTAGLPDPDLLVRTGGEMRISNFLLWQIAYSEIYVTDVLWPDFGGLHLLKAVHEYQQRERRYGNITSYKTENLK